MPRASKKTILEISRATAAFAKAQGAVYAAVPRNDAPWSECYLAASDAVRSTYGKAQDRLIEAERRAIDLGQAWRSSFGVVYLNS